MRKVVRIICFVLTALLGFQVAQAATWQASSQKEEAALAGDGDLSSFWASSAVTAFTPQWLMVDLGEKIEFSALKLFGSGRRVGNNYYSPQGLLEGSNDPTAFSNPQAADWTKIADFDFPNTAGPHTLSFGKQPFALCGFLYSQLGGKRESGDRRIQLLPSLLVSAQVKGIKINSHIAGTSVTLSIDAEVAKTFLEPAVVELVVKKMGARRRESSAFGSTAKPHQPEHHRSSWLGPFLTSAQI